MTPNACPTCGAAIDPARAPVARVRAGKVVTFCSLACAERSSDEVASAAAAPSPPKRDPGAARDALAVASPGYPPHRTSARASRRRRIIALSSAMLIGGMAITIISAFSPSTPTNVRAASPGDAAERAASSQRSA
ncbi:MAG: hypothetical protein Tsb0020_35920 [Haliangiales bacterium]